MVKELEQGMYFSDRCQFCHEFGEKVEPYLCPDCIEKIRKIGYVKLADIVMSDEQLEELEVIPREDELPTIDEFVGSDPNYTGDMTTEEYIRSIRNG